VLREDNEAMGCQATRASGWENWNMPATWSDAPIEAQADDVFDRVPYAVHAAQLIMGSHSWDDSIVFGLTGPWGSGKSSMISMIVEEIEKPGSNWRVARFTPWATSDVPGLLEDFYASSAKPCRRTRGSRSARRWAR
jgi:hypothetical protein